MYIHVYIIQYTAVYVVEDSCKTMDFSLAMFLILKIFTEMRGTSQPITYVLYVQITNQMYNMILDAKYLQPTYVSGTCKLPITRSVCLPSTSTVQLLPGGRCVHMYGVPFVVTCIKTGKIHHY